jgi:hypothetical protein
VVELVYEEGVVEAVDFAWIEQPDGAGVVAPDEKPPDMD